MTVWERAQACFYSDQDARARIIVTFEKGSVYSSKMERWVHICKLHKCVRVQNHSLIRSKTSRRASDNVLKRESGHCSNILRVIVLRVWTL